MEICHNKTRGSNPAIRR